MSPAIAIPPPSSTKTAPLPIVRKHTFPTPLLRLQLHDLSHEGASIFLSHIHGNEDLEAQVQNVLNLLYFDPKKHAPRPHVKEEGEHEGTQEDVTATSAPRPGTRSVTFIIRDFEGAAYTTGTDLDDDHKEINISTTYITRCARNADKRNELLGVICHELVHCFQWNSQGTCSGGLIEGIADWVRLRAGLGAAHWKQEAAGSWDGGYQKTGYFLEWLEERFGEGFVRRLNGCLREGKYDEEKLFAECCEGKKVGELWEVYRGELEKKKGGEIEDGGAANPVPTHPARKLEG